jgi:serine/threonine protein kinase
MVLCAIAASACSTRAGVTEVTAIEMQRGPVAIEGRWQRTSAGIDLDPGLGTIWYRITPPALTVDDPALQLSSGRFVSEVRQGSRPTPAVATKLMIPLRDGREPVFVRAEDVGQQVVPRVIAGSQRRLWQRTLQIEFFPAAVGVVMTVVGAMLLIASLRRGGSPAYRGLGLFFLPLGVLSINALRQFGALLPLPALAVQPLHHVVTSLYPIGFALFTRTLFGDSKRALARKGLRAYGAFLAVGWTLYLTGIYDFYFTRDWVALFIVFFAVHSIVLAARRAKGGDSSAKVYLLGIATLLGFGLFDLLPFENELQLTTAGIVAFSLSLGVVIERQFSAAKRDAEKTAEDLAHKVAAIEKINNEVSALNAELRHQVASRSRELSQLLQGASATVSTSRTLREGDTVAGRYKVVRVLGEGGMGAVYEVERSSDAKHLALKIMTKFTSPTAAARFAREAEIAARIVDEHLVSVLDVGGAATGELYLVMELVKGTTLDAHSERFGDVRWCTDVLEQIARGLAALHRAGVVHRDMKPSNVLLEQRGAAVFAKIADFGIANFEHSVEAETSGERLSSADSIPAHIAASETIDASADRTLDAQPAQRDSIENDATMASEDARTPRSSAQLTATGAIMGTPAWMAPESVRGSRQVRASADMFAFGIIAYEMLSGRAPWEVAPALLALSRLEIPGPAPLAESVPSAVRALVMQCLSVDPAQRPSAESAVATLAAENKRRASTASNASTK